MTLPFAPPAVNPGGGVSYAGGLVLPALEGDLYGGPAGGVGGDPIPISWAEAVAATVEFSVQGSFSSQTSYVVLQTDFGDGVWFDVAWCVFTQTSGSANFLLSGGVAGANAFGQTRIAGTAPAANGSNQCPLGDRIRFVGKASIVGSSSSSSSSNVPSTPSQVTVSIKYKLLGLR